MTEGARLLTKDLREAIEDAIRRSAPAWDEFVNKNRAQIPDGERPPDLEEDGRPVVMAMKYTASSRAKDYLYPATKGFFIGNKDFTWGKAVYVNGVDEPLSGAIYGRAGLVSYFRPVNWRAFDARDPDKAGLYLDWLHGQQDYPDAVLTVHSDHFLHNLRTYFREQFSIDVVLCGPDEFDDHTNKPDPQTWYTDPAHTWLAVSDWVPNTNKRKLAGGYSPTFRDVRLTIVAEEEFAMPPDPDPSLPRPRFPASRIAQLGVSRVGPSLVFGGSAPWSTAVLLPTGPGGSLQRHPPAPTSVQEAYWRREIVRVQS
ncbi:MULTISPECIES: hypothetical protein [unclassified Mycobacterium]|uniref:hypothetical protein n=1 Tax=unclassified Mycobacterium TaxID=2642494 RepID=UPI000AB14F4F|nr:MULTISPECIES: hypothetical protein [unclassified Mycobacterium]